MTQFITQNTQKKEKVNTSAKKMKFFEKLAMTFGATRNLLRELKQKGVVITRGGRGGSYQAGGL